MTASTAPELPLDSVPPIPETPPSPPPPSNQTVPPPLSPPIISAAEQLGGVITPDAPYAWSIGDAPYSFYTVIYRKQGIGVHWVSVTVRGIDALNTFNNFEAVMQLCAEHGWEPPTSQPASSVPPSMPAGQASHPPTPDVAPASPPADGTILDSGTGELHSVTVDTNGHVKFRVGKLQYDLTDARGHEQVLSLFDKSLGWTLAHFAKPAIYPLDGSGLKADWIKKAKMVKGEQKTYYDVVRIHL